MELRIELTKTPKTKPAGALGFGKIYTDHMFEMDYDAGTGWHDARIVPYHAFETDPAMMVYHYGQAIFEGMKAYRNDEGEVTMFRPALNVARLNASAGRLCMPEVDEEFVLGCIARLVEIEREWIPTEQGTSLYIRPVMISTEVGLGVHTAQQYKLYVICSPVGAYYAHGFAPVSLKVEDKYVRASKGGTGHYKFAGNYASSILAADIASKEGYDQVMWLDAKDRRYVEEVGSMNIFFAFGDRVVTPMLAGSILPGITRRSAIEYLRAKGYAVEERLVSIDELVEGARDGTLTEIFGTGTAAVISPVGMFGYQGTHYTVGDGRIGRIAAMLFDNLTGIQSGRLPDEFGWVYRVK